MRLKNSLFIFLLILLSCNDNRTLFLSDEIFHELYSIKPWDFNVEYINYKDDGMIIDEYSTVITNGFVYNSLESFKEFTGSVEVLNYYGPLFKDTHIKVNPNYTDLVEKIENNLSMEVDSRFGYIVDYRYSINTDKVKTLFKIKRFTNRGEIESFIDSHPEIDCWVVLNKDFANYIYNKIKGKKIVLMDSSDLLKYDSNIIAIIETDYKSYLKDRSPVGVNIKKR